ncbi:phosphomevalonate kinase [Labedella endophytica]|uniref:phosphomevalonate kinase n=1 Tax=Labedella endophytica TaxID=1523160 RepID=A0A433JN80_9MICO|nr:phosphomevalonate kinase [Labedella endophytica]RUQ97539.1 phosphomevalonate kinase [Labedella endophytica]
MIEVSAPGKLFIAGEYAVVEPGYPAVLIAVDRFVTVTLAAAATGTGRLISDQFGHLPVLWRRDGDRLVIDRDQRPFDYVLSAIRVVEAFAVDSGRPLAFYDLTIRSELDDRSGRKFGLGSSAAVTVATVTALDRFYGLGLDELSRLKLALLATIGVNPLASGGDVAASLYGGWIAFSSPDREWVLDHHARSGVSSVVAADWPGLSIRRLSPLSGGRLVVGWTGEPASTAQLVDGIQQRKRRVDTHYEQFLGDSRACVDALVEAFDSDDLAGAQAQLHRARRLLVRLGVSMGMSIETPELTLLCDSAEYVGAAAKSSGAGGGDCGIVLADEATDLDPMFRRWELGDIRRLSLHVHGGAEPETTA